jgi:hypothetical protein
MLHTAIFTDKLCEHVGLDRDTMFVLAKMNDGQHKSFDEIAEWIEQNL